MATAYDRAFFSYIADDSLRSARVIVPLVMDLLAPKSVLDVGCGPGAWLREFAENGVGVIQGIDGDYLERAQLLIDPTFFVASDLTEPITLDREYDLALCIEVAEHLPPSSASMLIEELTAAAQAVMFSAAIPGQEGVNHVNEQWLDYWRVRFSTRGFTMIDVFRPRIRDDSRIASYIRQNLVLFVADSVLASRPKLRLLAEKTGDFESEWVHADLYKKWLSRETRELGVKELLRKLPSAIVRSVVRRLRPGASPGTLPLSQSSDKATPPTRSQSGN
jgi:SAM-dependent methyltransferase